jgi:hypothetical protein
MQIQACVKPENWHASRVGKGIRDFFHKERYLDFMSTVSHAWHLPGVLALCLSLGQRILPGGQASRQFGAFWEAPSAAAAVMMMPKGQDRIWANLLN